MKQFFEGRYYKHQKGNNSICFIVGYADDSQFIQVITNEKVLQYNTLEYCTITPNSFEINAPEIRGKVEYKDITPIQGNIMGPFQYFPMQCSHEVVSMYHTLSGGFWIENQWLDLQDGVGYIEGDKGRSFPKKYLWLQCNDFPQKCSIMVSVAHIPFAFCSFTGCICSIIIGTKEYRMATYKGVKIVKAEKECIILKQGNLRLEIYVQPSMAHPLKSPFKGKMVHTIHESNCSFAQFHLYENDKEILKVESNNCSFEYQM